MSWTSPRAYIINMSAAQTRQLHVASMAKLHALYAEYVAALAQQAR